MACPNKITQSIINTCNPVKGVEPIIYWDYRSNLAFTFVDNTITAITAAPLGRIEAKKFAINAGHEVVALENQANRFKHKLDAIINDANHVVDEMDDVVFFVKENASTTWKVYGAKYGCWKETQAAMINDNLGTIAVGFASREGMEEEYECYNTSIDIAALPNMETFDLIYGGTMPNGGVVKLIIDSDKTGYIKLPNGTILTTVAGVIDTTYTGVGGAITYYVPKNTTIANLGAGNVTGITGAIVTNFTNTLEISSQVNITSLTSKLINSIICIDCSRLTDLICGSLYLINAKGASLSAKSIGDILYQAYIDNRANVNFDFSGGTNALFSAVEDYIDTVSTTPLANILTALRVTGDVLIDGE